MGQSVGTLGGRHAGRRRHGLQRSDVVRPRRQLPQRRAARRRALHAHERDVSRTKRRSRIRRCSRAVEDEHAALPAPGAERAAHGLQVRGVRRRVDVRPVAQEAAEPVMSVRTNEDRKRRRTSHMRRRSLVVTLMSGCCWRCRLWSRRRSWVKARSRIRRGAWPTDIPIFREPTTWPRSRRSSGRPG